MKFCIGMMFQNEAAWLRLHLPVLMSAEGVDGLVGLDGGSDDGSADVIREFGGVVHERAYAWPPVDQHNALIAACEKEGYDAMVKVDPDELFFPEHLTQMKDLLGRYKALRFPSYHFQGDRGHYAPAGRYYPDPHIRAWVLHQGVRYAGDFHSMIRVPGARVNGDGQGEILDCPHIHLYHYGDIKSRWARGLRALNIQRHRAGLPPVDELLGLPPAHPFHVPFTGPQPLATDNVRAPVFETRGVYVLCGSDAWGIAEHLRQLGYGVPGDYLNGVDDLSIPNTIYRMLRAQPGTVAGLVVDWAHIEECTPDAETWLRAFVERLQMPMAFIQVGDDARWSRWLSAGHGGVRCVMPPDALEDAARILWEFAYSFKSHSMK